MRSKVNGKISQKSVVNETRVIKRKQTKRGKAEGIGIQTFYSREVDQ